ncbi:MAG TPA: hypothetical protein VN522_10280 [Solirubrobacterales bacterium]|nr:hypothetical protein [Solirubrobacterales bacterium]
MSKLTRPRRRLATLIAGCCLFVLGASGTAAADSLVFIKENNVWLSKPDGSGQYQVTLDGTQENPYQSPSQADDGTIVASRKQPNGGPLYRMEQNGELINAIPVGALIAGPFNPQVSPDGATVAYEQVFSRNVNGYFETSSDVRFTRTDGSTPQGMGEVGRGAGAPSWIDSGHAFVGINMVATTVVPGQAPVEWWSDYDHQPTYFNLGQTVEDGEVAPNGNIAVVRGELEGNTIQLYRSTGSYTSLPTPTCTLSEPSPGPAGKRFVDPTFSPGGDAIAWQEGNGVWSTTVPENCLEGQPHLVIPGATEPDWGPADVNPGPRATPAPAPPAPPVVAKPRKHSPGDIGAHSFTTSLSKALAKGLKLQVEAPGAGLLSGVAKLKGRPVASGSRKIAGAGETVLALHFPKAARARLGTAGRVKLVVDVSFRPAKGGKPQAQRVTVTLKR